MRILSLKRAGSPAISPHGRVTMEHNLEWFDQYLFQTPAKATAAENKAR